MPRAATRVKLVKAKTFVLSPNKRYMITFKNAEVSHAQADALLHELENMGVRAVGVSLAGDNDLRVIELPGKESSDVQ
jgi:hypothetical protein